MRKTLSTLVLVGTVASLGACGDAGRQQSALDDAIRLIEVAEQGYATGDERGTLDAHRRQNLTEAAEKLRPVATGGTPGQQVIAKRLLAEVASSTSRLAAKDAAAGYAQIAPQAIDLLGYAVAADRAAALGMLMDQRQPEVVAALQTEVQRHQQRSQQLRQEVEQLQQQLAAEEAEVEQIHARRDEAMGRAQALRDQAFVASGDERYELESQAAVAQRESTVASAEADRRQLNMDMLRSRLNVAESQLRLTNDLVQELQNRIQAARQRQGEVEQGIAEATRARNQHVGQLQSRLNEIMTVYRQEVDQRLQQAGTQLDESIRLLQEAQGQAQGQQREGVQLDLLAARSAQAHLYAEHLLVTAGFHDVLATLRQGLKEDEAPGLAEAAAQLNQRLSELAGQARQAIQAGQELAQQLQGSGGNVGEAAERQVERFARYAQRVDAVSVQ